MDLETRSPTGTLSDKLGSFLRLTREAGPTTAIRRSVEFGRHKLPIVLYTHVRRARYRMAGRVALPDPYEVLEVRPADVRYHTGPSVVNRDYRKHFGEIRPGDWDVTAEPIERHPKYEACRKRVEEGVPWTETGIIDHTVAQLHASDRGVVEHDCRSRADIVDLYEGQRESLYRSLKEEGFRRDASRLCCRVHVGRDGRLILGQGGRHRFFLSRLLGIETVPVQVLIRHEGWQALREEVYRAEGREELSDAATAALDHPDMRDLVDEALT